MHPLSWGGGGGGAKWKRSHFFQLMFVGIIFIFDRFEKLRNFYEDLELEGPRNSQYAPSVGDGEGPF